MTFDELWKYIAERNCITVQEYNELKFVYDLIEGSASYLEVGTAEGNSLYVLAHALAPNARITYIDLGEVHTTPHRNTVIDKLKVDGFKVHGIHGNSTDPSVIALVQERFDIVLIDAGHTYEEVLSDARNYGKLADKYVIFHDINLLPVRKAFEEYQEETGLTGYMISNSETFGYGIIEKK